MDPMILSGSYLSSKFHHQIMYGMTGAHTVGWIVYQLNFLGKKYVFFFESSMQLDVDVW